MKGRTSSPTPFPRRQRLSPSVPLLFHRRRDTGLCLFLVQEPVRPYVCFVQRPAPDWHTLLCTRHANLAKLTISKTVLVEATRQEYAQKPTENEIRQIDWPEAVSHHWCLFGNVFTQENSKVNQKHANRTQLVLMTIATSMGFPSTRTSRSQKFQTSSNHALPQRTT